MVSNVGAGCSSRITGVTVGSISGLVDVWSTASLSLEGGVLTVGRSQGETNLEGISEASDDGGFEDCGIGTPLSTKSCTAGETSLIWPLFARQN